MDRRPCWPQRVRRIRAQPGQIRCASGLARGAAGSGGRQAGPASRRTIAGRPQARRGTHRWGYSWPGGAHARMGGWRRQDCGWGLGGRLPDGSASSSLRLAIGTVLLAAVTVGCTGRQPATRPGGEPSVGVRIPVPQPFRVAAGKGSVWVLSRGPMPCSPPRPCTVSRLDPGSNRLVGTPARLPADYPPTGGVSPSVPARCGRPSSTDA
jgi:hypothetical protein